MTVDTDPVNASLVEVIHKLTAELAAQRKSGEEARREITRLVQMVEGLTGQLDVLLRDRDEERRAGLAKMREAARARHPRRWTTRERPWSRPVVVSLSPDRAITTAPESQNLDT